MSNYKIYPLHPNATHPPIMTCEIPLEEYESIKRENAQLKSEIERLEILCADYRHDCDNLAISNEQAKRAARTLLKKMNHNKYKRCLAMARWCDAELLAYPSFGTESPKEKWWQKWHKRWLEIAEKFKPNNSTAQLG